MYTWFYIQLIVIDPYCSRYKKGMLFGIKLKNVKIPSYPSIYENVYKLQKIFLVRGFWLKYIFRIKFKIPILDLMLLPNNSVPFEGLYSSNCFLNLLVKIQIEATYRFPNEN